MKKTRNNPLQIKIKAQAMPVGVGSEEYLTTLLESVDSGVLPEDWDISIAWRNPATKQGRSRQWQEDEFMGALAASSSGFMTAVKRVIRRGLAKVRREPLPRARGKRGRFLKRSLAAIRGWESRWKSGRSVGPKGRAFLERESERGSD
jgi:hypothetical protein